MADEPKEDTTIRIPIGMLGLLELLVRSYGAYAYSTLVLLLLWTIILAPELAKRDLDFANQQKVVEQQSRISMELNKLSSSAETQLLILERILKHIDHERDPSDAR